MIEAKIRRQGNSFIVTIPRDEMEKYDLHEGDQIAFSPAKLKKQYVLEPKLQSIADEIFSEYKDVFEYLAER